MLLEDDGLELLSDAECLALLAGADFGRIGISVGALPVILPVNYGLIDGNVVFATGEGTKLRAALRNAVVAFEVDAVCPDTHAGWSVLVVGTASEITAAAEREHALRCGLGAGEVGVRPHLVRLRTEFLSGRRIPALAAAHRHA